MGKRKNKVVGGLKRDIDTSADAKLHPEAECAWKTIRSHGAVEGDIEFPKPVDDGGFEVSFNMKVSLPSRACRKGITETGVKSHEPIILLFPPTYPFHAPTVLLRPDFNKSLPHINPIYNRDEKDYVNPCLYYGPLNDLLHQEGDGLSEILNQLSEWLSKAAINDLIDPNQGWEPIRRDNTFGWMVYDLTTLRRLIKDAAGALVFQCRFYRDSGRERPYFAWVADRPSNVTPALMKNSYLIRRDPHGPIYGSLMILVWSDSHAVADRYLPEDIKDLHQLYERAKDYSILNPLRSIFLDFDWAFKQASLNIPLFSIFVVLCARRPHALIQDDSPVELIPYVIECQIEDERSHLPEPCIRIRENSRVLPLGHRHKVSRSLLQRMSGGKELMHNGTIVHIGCGSVGSKIAMHLARSGYGPFELIDKAPFSPHNVARHALTPVAEIPGLPKASLLSHKIELLQLGAEAINEDIIEICTNPRNTSNPFSQNTRLIIESTGSVAVRDMLASLPNGKLHGKLFHAAMYEQGKVGIMAIEGDGRNPNVNDLVIRFWDETIDNPGLRFKFSGPTEEVSRQDVGLGCGSHTMVMSDARISLFAAAMAERAKQLLELENDVLKGGELWIGMLDEYQLGTSWKCLRIDRTIVLKVKIQNLWEIRILSEAANQIIEEAKSWGATETGGVLIGRISLPNRHFTVSRVLEAPSDSTRSPISFVLGIEGLKRKVREIHDKSGGTLSYVGTWHSHPKGGTASPIDKNSLKQIRRLRFGAPTVGLIWTPYGIHAEIDEGKLT